jgi:hypothetical protein
VVGPVNGDTPLTEVCKLGRVSIGGSVSKEESKAVRMIFICEEGEFAVDGRFFCSFLGGDEVSRNEFAPPPKDIRRPKELDRLCVLLAKLEVEAVLLDHLLRFPP